MSFQYGSDSPDIKNPFRQEGLLFLGSGMIILAMGILSLFTLRSQIINEGMAVGWVKLLVCIILLTSGLTSITKGLFKIFRFYLGRNIPSSLSKNLAPSEKHSYEPNVVYPASYLDQMIMGRKNLTFKEPVTLFDRLVYSIYPKFLFLPYAMRNYIHVLVNNAGYTIIALVVYLLALLSGSVGLTLLTSSSFSGWLGIALAAFLLLIWFMNGLSIKKVTRKGLNLGRRSNFVWAIILAILVPVIAEYALRNGIAIPEAPFSPVIHLIGTFVLIPLMVIVGLVITKKRAEKYAPVTEVSEFREHWQENVHPKDFFRSLDMEMASLRYREIPNRVYRELSPNLNMEGSLDKGSFIGDTIQETQPIYEEIIHSNSFKNMRWIIAVSGHALVASSAVLLFMFGQTYATESSIHNIFNLIYFPVLFWLFGKAAITLAHLYWGEMQFTSYLIQFQGEGTYTESKLSAGMAITDSVRSENTVVRTSFSPWLLVTKIVTSTQAGSGSNNLTGPRYIMSMNKADDLLEHLVKSIREFLDDREMIAKSVSRKDMNAIHTIFSFNEAAPTSDLRIEPNKQTKVDQIADLTNVEKKEDEEE